MQVNTDGDPTSTLLQNCAGSPGKYPDKDKFFLLTSANQMVATFQQIGDCPLQPSHRAVTRQSPNTSPAARPGFSFAASRGSFYWDDDRELSAYSPHATIDHSPSSNVNEARASLH